MELTSAQINISWSCDLYSRPGAACPYCWVTMSHPDRSRKPERPAEEWLEAILRHIPTSAVLDFVGGEPTVFPQFHWLAGRLCARYRWSVTSNMGGTRFRKYCEEPVPNCLAWTASYHPSSGVSPEEFGRKCRAISRHYPVQVNVLDYPLFDARAAVARIEDVLADRPVKVFLSPFEDVRKVNVAGPIPLTCEGGRSHIVLDPEGNVYKCLTQERRADRERWRIGNIFRDGISWPAMRSICYLPCDQYYLLYGQHAAHDMWQLDILPLEVPDEADLSAYRSTIDLDGSSPEPDADPHASCQSPEPWSAP